MLGTVHGVAQSVSSAARTVGPMVFAWGFGRSLEWGVIGAAWWSLAVLAAVGAFTGQFLWEGNGHEIKLEGEGEVGRGG